MLYEDHETHHRDAHGPAVSAHERYTWIFDRCANVAEVFDSASGERVNTVDLVSPFSARDRPGGLARSGARASRPV